MSCERLHIDIKGRVQGVGFRPFVARLARQYQLSGWVLNNSQGVSIETQGANIQHFLSALNSQYPPTAKIDSIDYHASTPLPEEQGFVIKTSDNRDTSAYTKIAPDNALCDNCRHDLFDSNSRFYHYPFVSCLDCGPRFSIIEGLPYDRCSTAFSPFTLCKACAQDHNDENNRRYHAQTIACAKCGPTLSQPVSTIAQALLDGKIVAIKAMGGYHLMVNARDREAVARLRQLKQRPHKPLATMSLNLASIKQITSVSEAEAKLLSSNKRPIVLIKTPAESIPAGIAPGLNQIGLMLPYTPLHYLIFYHCLGQPQGYDWLQQPCALMFVATSANLSGEPIISNDDDAEKKLPAIADLIVAYNRQIISPNDDSVKQCLGKQAFFIRRSRAYVPEPIELAQELPPTLALGAYEHNTICLTRQNEAYLSPHIGKLKNPATIRLFHQTIEHWQHQLNIKPQCVVIDKQPDYYAARYAEALALPRIAVQHHHAHLAQVAAEHHLTETALGLVLDGHGYGDDGQSWGGELLLYQNTHYQRLAHLSKLSLPGGDLAAESCWRMGVSLLHKLNHNDLIKEKYDIYPWQNLVELLNKPQLLTQTTSCGRYFDAVSSLLGVCQQNSYQGEAPLRLESLVTEAKVLSNGWKITDNQLDLKPLLHFLLSTNAVDGANYFHGTIVAALSDWVVYYLKKLKLETVLLAGGCFYNRYLSSGLYQHLSQLGYHVYLPRQTPIGDGGLSLGQAWLGGLEHVTCV
ncbi:MAG: carbamoyltransferase HypF [Pseudomonadota bacterium]